MRNIFLTLAGLLCAIGALAQPRANYYTSSTLDGKNGRELELALKACIKDTSFTHVSYSSLWNHYKTTDLAPQDSIPSWYTGDKTDLVYDMYAWMKDFPKFYQDNNHEQTGGINREHCVPNSWWGGESGNPNAYTDLHHLVPSDGAANNAKANWPLGEYQNGMTLAWPKETRTNSTYSPYRSDNAYMLADTQTHSVDGLCYRNASHVWNTADTSLYSGAEKLFEPADEYKGDFARMYLYIVCAYEGEIIWRLDKNDTFFSKNYMFENVNENGFTYTHIKDWALKLLLRWHRQDPVSDKERARNNAVESIQHNRNPFIDYPELVEYIWGDRTGEQFYLTDAECTYSGEINLVANDGNYYYATFSADRAVAFKSADVFAVSVENGQMRLHEIESRKVPANTGVLLRSTVNSDTYTYIHSAAQPESNDLRPASEAKEDSGYKFYMLAYGDAALTPSTLGFYWGAANGGAFVSREGSAYLAIAADAAIQAHYSFADEVTALEDTKAGEAVKFIENGTIYIKKNGQIFNAMGQVVRGTNE